MEIIWKGQYSYNQIFDENESFDFELKVHLENGSFIGYATEFEFAELTGGALPSIKGFFEDDHISFIKKYPYKYDSDLNGYAIIDKNQKGHEVVYDGFLNAELAIWEGTWEIIIEEEKIGKGVYRTYSDVGSWRMKQEFEK